MASRPRTRPGVVPVSREGRPRVRLSGPGALVACLPQLIGFEPVESLVLVGLVPGRAGRRELGLTLRVDLDDVEEAIQLAHGDDADDRADAKHAERELDPDEDPATYSRHRPAGPLPPCHPLAMAAALVRNRCVAAQIVVVSDRSYPPRGEVELDDLGHFVVAVTDIALGQAGVDVVDAVLVRDGRWWSYFCTVPTCCPPEGTLVNRADADLLAAERAWAGESSAVLPGRELIVAKVAPDSGPAATAVAELLSEVTASSDRAVALAVVAELLSRFGEGTPEVEPRTWAQLLLDLHDVVVRDGCMPPWKGDVGAASLALWCAATRVAPPGHVAAPATLAALTAHARGDGALAGEAVARALTDDPGYRLARYAAQALGGGIPPSAVRRMVVEATAVLRARGEPVIDASGRLIQQVRRP